MTSNQTGNWNNPLIWTPPGIPTFLNDIVIANGNIVDINVDATVNSVSVTGSSTLRYATNVGKTLTVNNDITINTGSTFGIRPNSNTTHTLDLKGNFINNGSVDIFRDAASKTVLLLTKNGSQTLSGSGTLTKLNTIVLNMGSSRSNVFDITVSSFSVASGFLTLTNGTLKFSVPSATTSFVPFLTSTTISANAGLWLNSAPSILTTSAGITLAGELTVSNGSLTIGNAADEDLVSNGGTVTVNGGTLNVAGKYNTNVGASTFSMSSGRMDLPIVGATAGGIAPFSFTTAGSQFNMSGGIITLRRSGGTAIQSLGYVNTGSGASSVSGGTIQLGHSTTPVSQTLSLNSLAPVPNLSIASANVVASMAGNSLNVLQNVAISAGTLVSNNLNIGVGGNWTSTGSYTTGNNTVTFNSSTAQSISRTGGETFNNLLLGGAGVKTFGSSILATGIFSIGSGATADASASNHTLTLRGNFTNDGSFISRSGKVILNGSSNQSIGGSSANDFFDLQLNNGSGAVLNSDMNLRGSLDLNNGIFNVNSKVLTMVSTSTATARIGQITGTGDISGNVVAQRFIPGGTTGWALIGSPMSSALTFSDWDDDMIITCLSCPDGYNNFTSVYSYDETQPGAYDAFNSYVAVNSISDGIGQGKGYWVYVGTALNNTSDITLDVTGAIRKSNYTIPLVYTNSGAAADDGWNLIHNPYPSPISWTSLRGATPNLDNAIYTYNADLNGGAGGHAMFVNNISSPAVGSGGIGDNIPMFQGFYVHSTGATALSAQESNKTTSNQVFLKTMAAPSNPMLRIFLKGTNNEDETVIYLQPGATQGFDATYDAYKLSGQDPLAPVLAAQNGSNLFQICGIAPLTGSLSIPIRAVTGYAGSYTISAQNTDFPKGACLYFQDLYTNTTTDLRVSDYVVNLYDTTVATRFRLNMVLNQLNVVPDLKQTSCAFPDAGKVKIQPSGAGPWNYSWSINGSPTKNTVASMSADSLYGLSSGNVEVEINTVGNCDQHNSSYQFNSKMPTTAAFSCNDTLRLEQTSTIQFVNNSTNAQVNYWDFGDNSGPTGAVSPYHSFSNPGIYNVRLITESGTLCTDTAQKKLVVTNDGLALSDPTNIDDAILVSRLQGNRYVVAGASPPSDAIFLKVIDLTGKELTNIQGTSNDGHFSFELSLATFSPGVYLMELRTADRYECRRLLVE